VGDGMNLDTIRASSRRSGILLAGATALISGFAVFFNSYGVRAWSQIADSATYTTLKNGTAALILLVAGIAAVRKGAIRGPDRVVLRRHWLGLAAIAVVGGSLPFLLFFEGLSRASSADAAFIHKTLVIWVALLAITLLREKLGPLHLAAIALLLLGQVALSGLGELGFGTGEMMILAATLLWSLETVIAKRVLGEVPPVAVAVVRMAGGTVILLVYVLAFADLSGLGSMTAVHAGWILATGVTLSGYVATWFAALARAQAVDVTAVLVGGALITAILNTGIRGVPLPSLSGVALVAVGIGLIAMSAWRRAVSDL
jgi:drug/metabolite transporter (DMT)-like permease